MASVPVLARLIGRRLQALTEHLPAALEGDVHGVHQARVASRRLRELLPIVGGAMKRGPARRLRRRLRSLTRALGPVRELDVMLASIDRMTESLSTPRIAVTELKRSIVSLRATRLASLRHRFDPARVDRLLARLVRLESALTTGPSPGLWRHTLANRIKRRALALNAAVADAGALFVSVRLHGVRIAVKKLRYALEVAGDTRAAATGSILRVLKDAQDVLGKLHDADVLLDSARRTLGAPTGADLPGGADLPADADLVEAIAWFDCELTAETRRLHARYLRRQALLVRMADRALESVGPRVEGSADVPVRRVRPRGGMRP